MIVSQIVRTPSLSTFVFALHHGIHGAQYISGAATVVIIVLKNPMREKKEIFTFIFYVL